MHTFYNTFDEGMCLLYSTAEASAVSVCMLSSPVVVRPGLLIQQRHNHILHKCGFAAASAAMTLAGLISWSKHTSMSAPFTPRVLVTPS